MINVVRAKSSDRILRAVTGLTVVEFENLALIFQEQLDKSKSKARKQKKMIRNEGGGRTHTLIETDSKLLFILFYMKCYPTYDLAGLLFEVDRAQPFRWVKELLPILEKSLGKTLSLPKRKIRSLREFLEFFPEVKEIIIDGTERPTQRPKDKEKQKEHYSGKKKRHTKKNIVITTKKKRVLVVTPTVPGKNHDYTILKKTKIPNKIPKKTRVFVDLGFKGIQNDYDLNIRIPHKKPRTKELTETQKKINKAISRVRVKVENTLSGIKRYRCISDICRTKLDDLSDKFMFIASGLWNYHLSIK